MGACLSGGNLSVPKVGASELINQCSFIHSGVHAPNASEFIDQCSFSHSGAHAPLASERIEQCSFSHSGAHAPLASERIEQWLCIHSGAHAPLASELIDQCSFSHSGVHAPVRGYLCQILCWDMERSGPTVEELPSQREDRELSLLQAATKCRGVSPCPPTASSHHHF